MAKQHQTATKGVIERIWKRHNHSSRDIFVAGSAAALRTYLLRILYVIYHTLSTFSTQHHARPSKIHLIIASSFGKLQSLATGERNSTAVGQLLGLCPQLEDLQLHWYNLRIGDLTDALLGEQHFFDRIADSCRFPSLGRCSLKGIYTTGTALLSFLRHPTRLSSLEMEELYLRRGNFHPMFSFLAMQMEHLEYVHVDDLWEERLIYFDAPGKPHFPGFGRSVGPNALTRTGADARRLIQYRFRQGRPLDSPKCANWSNRRTLHYGPPS